jgi:hypothetical protein
LNIALISASIGAGGRMLRACCNEFLCMAPTQCVLRRRVVPAARARRAAATGVAGGLGAR